LLFRKYFLRIISPIESLIILKEDLFPLVVIVF